MDRIAFTVDHDGTLAEFFSIKEILIYEKKDDWAIVDRFSSDMDSSCAASVRITAESIGKKILERKCNHIVGKEIIGIPYHTLCRTGLEVLEADEINEELLDSIYHDFLLKENEGMEEIEMVPPHPIPIDDESNYFLDFSKALKANPGISSKKMLMPFLTNDLFFSLHIRCDHMMPWLEEFIKIRGLKMESERNNGISHILITHKSCNE